MEVIHEFSSFGSLPRMPTGWRGILPDGTLKRQIGSPEAFLGCRLPD